MYSALYSHINKFIDLSNDEQEILAPFLKSFSVKKKAFLLSQEQTCRANYFVVKGCLRLYFIDIKGAEQTTQFAIENWWITDLTSFLFQERSEFYIQAAETTEVITIEHHHYDEMFHKLPKLERYFRLILQKNHQASQRRIKFLYSQTAEERYRNFNSLFPEFVQRVPQYMLASYLGFTPEFLSKIRAKK
ncbi:Crp/Fnr family transcriptional regulator [Pedobacter alluvionis]|uniref:CRP-like cAMP-binding protein n=1 Tax=Pedobacter alluvionis TaxID=475253 RepID=A0A497XY48_9SPHI|nr:Crp/Fnr family transcriptional regulator [Pedobacter alluvionis]RLJ73788.1 CRP-like cAMP-binding protein [Pedobacter alluvionis]TFB32600.1 Crp/Fnr family transcriptional regulator [Pedobacter alluvionis]